MADFRTFHHWLILAALVAVAAGCGGDDGGKGGGGSGGNSPPIVTLTQLPADGSSGNVAILYTITDPDSATVTITIEVQDQSAAGNPFVDISTDQGSGSDGVSGLSASAAGQAHIFVWDTSAVALAAPVTFVVRITPNDGTSNGAAATSGAFTIDNSGGGITITAPEVYAPTPDRTLYGNAFVPFSLVETNATQQPANTVQVQFSTDSGANWNDCTEAADPVSSGTSGLLATTRGRDHVFVWNTAADIAATESDVLLRFVPVNTSVGTAFTTGSFAVDNAAAPARGNFAGMTANDLGSIDHDPGTWGTTSGVRVHYGDSEGGTVVFSQPDSGNSNQRLLYRTFDSALPPTLGTITGLTASAPAADHEVVFDSSAGDVHAIIFRESGGAVFATRFTSATGSYSLPTQIDTGMFGVRGHITAHRSGKVIALWVDGPANDLYASCWDDGAGNFSSRQALTPAGTPAGGIDVSIFSIEFTLAGNAHIVFGADDGSLEAFWHVYYSAHDDSFSAAQRITYDGTGAGDATRHSVDPNSNNYGGRILGGGTEFFQQSILRDGHVLAMFCQDVNSVRRGLANYWDADEQDDSAAWQGCLFIDDNQAATRVERLFFNTDLLNKNNPRLAGRAVVWQQVVNTSGEWALFVNTFDGSNWAIEDASDAISLSLTRVDNGAVEDVTYAEINHNLNGNGILTFTQVDVAGDVRLYGVLYDHPTQTFSATPTIVDNCLAGDDVLLTYNQTLAANPVVFPTPPKLFSFQGLGAATAVISYRAERSTAGGPQIGVAMLNGNNADWLNSTWVTPHESDVVDGTDTAVSIAGTIEAKVIGIVYPDRTGDAMCIGARFNSATIVPTISLRLRLYDSTIPNWAATTGVGSNPVYVNLASPGDTTVPGFNNQFAINPDWTEVDGTMRVMAGAVMDIGGTPRLRLFQMR